MFRIIFTGVAAVYGFIYRISPVNRLIAWAKARGLRASLLVSLLAIPMWVACSTCAVIVRDGGPGWVNLLVILFFIDAAKFAFLPPVAVVSAVGRQISQFRANRRIAAIRA
jgi:hypothetical protein